MAAPYVVVQQVFDNAVATATALANNSAATVAGIATTLSGLSLPNQVSVPAFVPPTISVPTITPLTLPAYSIPATSVTPDTFAADFTQKLADTQAQVASQLTTFFNTYFPMTLNDNELTLAQGWVVNVLTGGGAMNPAIENQYWQRDRDRIARESSVKQSEIAANWAARGFVLPPGAAVGGVLAAQRTALEQVSQSSREVAIKKYETEVLLQQKAIEIAIELRKTAIGSMVDFIKTLVFAPRENAVAYGQISAQATKAANDALVSYFAATTQANINLIDAQSRVSIASTSNQLAAGKMGVDASIAAADLALRANLGTTDIAVRQNETAGNWGLTIAGKRIDAALASASMTATMASAALNGIHATAGVSGSDSTNTQLYG
jgi:hypothetical protein